MIRFGYDIEFRNLLKFDRIFLTVDDFVFTFIFSVFYWIYSRVHISSDEIFSKILKKPSIVKK